VRNTERIRERNKDKQKKETINKEINISKQKRNRQRKEERNKREVERSRGKENKRNECNGPHGCRGRTCSFISALTGCYVQWSRRMEYRYLTQKWDPRSTGVGHRHVFSRQKAFWRKHTCPALFPHI
jgi:hypothetical protein